MKTYEETLAYIKVNKHLYEHEVTWTQAAKLDAKLEVVAFVFNKLFIDVVNTYADIK